MPDQDSVAVFHGDSFMEAELIKGLLEGEGILCRIPGELATDQFTAAKQVTGGRELDVRVSPADFEKARGIIRQAIEDGQRLAGFLAANPDAAPESG